MQKPPNEKCPRFQACNVPVCPLEPLMDERLALPGEEKCTLGKTIRLRLGKDLPWLGLTPRENAAKCRWDALPESEKEIIKKRASEVLKKSKS